ncbi:hypothetical protein D7U87_15545 [Stenotrophomonas maltophilia]|nr:hypothetical protein [Stenotrophomonas maltophilia]
MAAPRAPRHGRMPASPQGDQGMSALQQLWNGISPCMEPGVGDCVVWWDAWAVFVAGIAVLSTVFLGLMTLRLGRVANKAAIAAAKASAAAAKIANDEAAGRLQNARDERLMLLLWIAGEMSAARSTIKRLQEAIAAKGLQGFKDDRALRQSAFSAISGLDFTNCAARADRMHAIGHPTAARLARGIALARTLSRDMKPRLLEEEHAESTYALLERALPRLREDLDVVADACIAAAVDCGIK